MLVDWQAEGGTHIWYFAPGVDSFVPPPRSVACNTPSRLPSRLTLPQPNVYPRTPSPIPAPALPLTPHADRSGQSVKTDAAKYFTHHDAEGIGAFLDADFEDLTSVLSMTVDYLAGPRPHVDRRPCCVFIARGPGFGVCLACLWRAWRPGGPLRESSQRGTRSRVVVGSRWGVATLTLSKCTAARCLL